MFSSRSIRLASILASLLMVFTMVGVDQADARRGGSFGSRGSRTFQQAPVTRTSPTQVAPVERSVTPRPSGQTTASPGTQAQARPGLGGGFGGNIMRGLFLGGLFGLMFGYGFGGIAGVFGLLLQLLLVGGAIALLLRFLRSRSAPAYAGAGAAGASPRGYAPESAGAGAPRTGATATGATATGAARPGRQARDEIGIGNTDLDTFERLLTELQTAYGAEDYDRLRQLATPEMASYLAQELGENASRGLRNEVSDIKLLAGDVAESWREGSVDYATAAMRYASRDVTRDRATGQVVEGDPDTATETTELWTFVRRGRGPWQLSAIQQA